MVDGLKVFLTDEEETELRAEWAANDEAKQARKYIENRKKEYPSIEQQLDIIYHSGIESWKDEIKKIKDKHPKPD